jgi:asparagine synthetase B (glutamine-hydrolysing)
MCGILLVNSKDPISIDIHLQAFKKLKSRGPDFDRYQYKNNIFIGQTVLHITGNDHYYHHRAHENFLAYNGEIYNYKQFGSYSNDIEFVDHAVNNNLDLFKQAWGPWAWAWSNNTIVRYATDPQGERCLYQYQDDSILIVCSEISPILEYINPTTQPLPYKNKLWTMLDLTPWKGIVKIQPGKLYEQGRVVQDIDSIWSWVREPVHKNINEAYEDFQTNWRQVTQLMTPNCPAALTYSGGLDSSVILSHIDNLDLYAVNCTGKDPIVDRIEDFLTADEHTRLHKFTVTEEQWASEFQQLMSRTCLPAQSWSHVGQWIVNRNCRQQVLFSGCGADELFGGYGVYQNLHYNQVGSSSPYSAHGDHAIWQRCLEVYHGDPRQATLLMDYWHQVVGCDARGIDIIAGAWGIEPRCPFLAKPIIELALNLPFEFKVGSVPKPLIRQLFLQRWSQDLVLPKMGFTGHANDSLPYLPISVDLTGDRLQDWKQIVTKSFYASHH